MKRYKLPAAFDTHFKEDPVLQQLKKDGEEHNRPESELFKAATAYLLDSRRYLFIELGRYLEKHGPLEPIDYDTGKPATTENNENESVAIEAEEEVPEEKSDFELKVLPPPTEQPRIKFSKTYSDDNQS
jgi:hypothetical protein